MNAEDHDPKDLPNPQLDIPVESSSKDEASKDTSKTEQGASSPVAQGDSRLATAPKKIGSTHPASKAKSNGPIEELRQTLRKKLNEAAVGLESVFGQEAIDQAKESWVDWKCEDFKKATTNYLRQCGKACKVDQAELVKEILKMQNIKFPTSSRKKSGKQTGVSKDKKGSGNAVKKGGGRAG